MEILLILPGFILAIVIVVIYEIKLRKPHNKVHFYVARDKDGSLWLYIGKPFRGNTRFHSASAKKVYGITYCIEKFGLKHEDFDYLKWEDEPVEVFLKLED